MNMKSLLKELVKDPQIKALYEEGFDRSLVNKLIIESLMEQDEDIQIPDAIAINQMYNDEKEQLRQKLTAILRNKKISKEIQKKARQAQKDIDSSVNKPRPEGQKTPAQPEASPDTKGEKSKRKYNRKKAALTKLGNKYPFETIVSALSAQNNFQNIKYLIDQALSHEQIKDKKQQEQAKVAVQNAIENNDNLQPEQKEELKQSVESVAQEKFEIVPREWIKGIADKFKNLTSEQKDEVIEGLNFLIIRGNPEIKQRVSSALVKLGVQKETAVAIVNNKQAVEELKNALSTSFEPGRQSLKELYDAIQDGDDEMIKKAVLAAYNYSKSEIGANFDNVVEQVKEQAEGQSLDKIKSAYIEAYEEHKDSLQLFEEPEELQPTTVDNNEPESASPEKVAFQSLIMLVIALYLFYSKAPTEEPTEAPTEEPGQPIPSSGTVSPKKYAELYDKYLEEKFDTFEDNFLRTPFLSTQSQVLTELVDAVSQFSDELSKKEKQSFSRTADADAKKLQEQEETEQGIELDRSDQKLIMVEHKVMQKYLKMLVKMVTSIDQKKINTVGFEQDSRKIRAIAKQLLESIIDLMKIIDSAQKEGRKGLEFKEGIIKEEATDDKKPRTQLTRDQIIDLMEQSYDLIVDYGTNIEKYSRTEAEAVELKPVQDAIEKLNQVFAKVLPYFPAHSPFGKTANLKEIKKQVRGISRDIIQVMKQAKGLAEKPENFDEQAITTFASVLLSTVNKLQKYFDLEIDDAEIKAMLPKVPPAKSASYGKDSDAIFSKIQDIIEKHGPSIAETLKDESIKSWEKVTNFVAKKLGEQFSTKNRKVVPEVISQIVPNAEVYIDTMEVITKFINFIVQMSKQGILNESIRDFFDQIGVGKQNKEFGKQFGKYFERYEIEEIKDYLSKEQNYQDLLGVVKQELEQPSDSWLFGVSQQKPKGFGDDETETGETDTTANNGENEDFEEYKFIGPSDGELVSGEIYKTKLNPESGKYELYNKYGKFSNIRRTADDLSNINWWKKVEDSEETKPSEEDDELQNFMKETNLNNEEIEAVKDFFQWINNDAKSEQALEEQIIREVIKLLREAKSDNINKSTDQSENLPYWLVEKIYNEYTKDDKLRSVLARALKKMRTHDENRFNNLIQKYQDKESSIKSSEETEDTKNLAKTVEKAASKVAEEEEINLQNPSEQEQEKIVQAVMQEPEVQQELQNTEIESENQKQAVEKIIDNMPETSEEASSETELDKILADIKTSGITTKEFMSAYIQKSQPESTFTSRLKKELKKISLEYSKLARKHYFADNDEKPELSNKIKKIKEQFKKVEDTLGVKMIVPELWDKSYLFNDNKDKLDLQYYQRIPNYHDQIHSLVEPGFEASEEQGTPLIKAKVIKIN